MPLVIDEDDFTRNLFYSSKLPTKDVECHLKIKDDMTLSGLGFFFEVFNYLLDEKFDYSYPLEFEGHAFKKNESKEIVFSLPFNVVLTGERVALNLLQMCSSISTYTKKFVEICEPYGIKVLDTRKTTPLYRALEKYAVRIGGGYNHRFGQTDVFMVKDNHKSYFGGIEPAVSFFKSVGAFYQDMVVEVHNLEELDQALKLGLRHLMLDNFRPEIVREALNQKAPGVTYEISGGINLSNIKNYCIEGVDAISIGSITYGAPKVDLSLKY